MSTVTGTRAGSRHCHSPFSPMSVALSVPAGHNLYFMFWCPPLMKKPAAKNNMLMSFNSKCWAESRVPLPIIFSVFIDFKVIYMKEFILEVFIADDQDRYLNSNWRKHKVAQTYTCKEFSIHYYFILQKSST